MLAVGELAGLRNGDGWFSVKDIQSLLEALRLPPPPDESAVLSDLKRKEWVRNRAKRPSWTVTPEGHAQIVSLLGQVDPAKADFEMTQNPGAEYGQARQPVLPPLLGPP